ncbi:MAG: YigZ family protein [Tidjanibacter sp.]|nr:YigZ family protein [Tidjanibacter sp.]
MAEDEYKTIAADSEALYKDRNSRFLTYAYHVTTVEQVKERLDVLYKKYYDATHHCYAYRLGPRGEQFRANDDGEPSGTAGKPILGQMLSREVTDCLVVVVRYFGGTKLGVPGLIEAYKQSTVAVLDESEIVLRTVDRVMTVTYAYEAMNDVMRVVKQMQPNIKEQQFDNICRMRLSIRESQADELFARLSSVEGATCEAEE